MPLGPLSTIPKLRSTLAATLLRSAHAALAQLRAAAAASAAAAAALAETAAAMAAAPPPPAPTPVFACLGMPALASCFDRAAAALADDAATRTRVVAAFESLLPPAGADQRAGDALRNAVTVCVVAWKAAPGTAGGGAAAEVAAVAAEMDGF